METGGTTRSTKPFLTGIWHQQCKDNTNTCTHEYTNTHACTLLPHVYRHTHAHIQTHVHTTHMYTYIHMHYHVLNTCIWTKHSNYKIYIFTLGNFYSSHAHTTRANCVHWQSKPRISPSILVRPQYGADLPDKWWWWAIQHSGTPILAAEHHHPGCPATTGLSHLLLWTSQYFTLVIILHFV